MQGILSWKGLFLGGAMLALADPASAAQVDIQGPPGSESFGAHVAVLPNGNIVVTDPSHSTSAASHVGAVHLFDPEGNPISMLTGSQADDRIGMGRIVVLATGHFVVFSRDWDNGGAIDAGAVTWINGDTGLSGTVSAQNSLVGSSANDAIGGYEGVTALPNGHYVVVSSSWSNAGAASAGAVTWGNGNGGTVGAVSPANSLVGTEPMDFVGNDQDWFSNIAILPNGNYVVTSWYWHHGSRTNAGAVTWGNGEGGTVGPVSASNSLLGTTDCSSDTGAYSQITVLTNGNYVVSSPCWDNGGMADVGASTWVDGSQPFGGEVSASNSLIGTQSSDRVGSLRATPLTNGNFVVRSWHWQSGTGATTWGDGSTGMPVGAVSISNSLTGSIPGDYFGGRTVALSNGHYVAGGWNWHNSSGMSVGVVTWGNGNGGTVGAVSEANSLVGGTQGDAIGFRGIAALPNGNYVVASPYWSNGSLQSVGAVTLLDGSGPISAVVTAENSLIGDQANDLVGNGGIHVLTNGAFVISSPEWNFGGIVNAGIVIWADGVSPLSGLASTAGSAFGCTAEDRVGGDGITPLANGHYVVSSSHLDLIKMSNAGAVTWLDGNAAYGYYVTDYNSLVGTTADDKIRVYGDPLSDGNYLVSRSYFGSAQIRSLSVIDGSHGSAGPLEDWNTVYVDPDTSSFAQHIAYDATRSRLVVGQPSSNKVILFRVNDTLFANGFD